MQTHAISTCLFLGLLVGLWPWDSADGQCVSSWTIPPGVTEVVGLPADTRVRSMTVFDDGTGSKLYVAGEFEEAGGSTANHIARWDGSAWETLGTFVFDDEILKVGVYDVGNGGPELFAAGAFTGRIVTWDPMAADWVPFSWLANPGTSIRDLELYGGSLYAAGAFSQRVRRYDAGTDTWVSMAGGISGGAYALEVHDDGGGAKLYVGGQFLCAGAPNDGDCPANGVPDTQFLASWDGAAWASVGGGVGTGTRVESLLSTSSGLYIGGRFDGVDPNGSNVVANIIALWDGVGWTAPGGGLGNAGSNTVLALAEFDDGTGAGSRLYAGGNFSNMGLGRVAVLDGGVWTALGGGVDSAVRALQAYEAAASPAALYVGGDFTTVDGMAAERLGAWGVVGDDCNDNGFADACDIATGISQDCNDNGMGNGIPDECDIASGLEEDCNGNGIPDSCDLMSGFSLDCNNNDIPDDCDIAAGTSGDCNGNGIPDECDIAGGLSDDGNEDGIPDDCQIQVCDPDWDNFVPGLSDVVYTTTVYQGELYAGGDFTIGGVPTAARWDGIDWIAVGGTLDARIRVLKVLDLGGGPRLYAGGDFTQVDVGGVITPVLRVAVLDEGTQTWQQVGTNGVTASVHDLVVYDDGSGDGPTLFVGSTGNGRIRRLNPNTDAWQLFQGGAPSTVRSLAVFQGNLYIAGDFECVGTTAIANCGMPGTVSALRIAYWDGAQWNDAVGGITGVLVWRLKALDLGDGNGERLYVGGRFSFGGAVAATNVAVWDGTDWSALGDGLGIDPLDDPMTFNTVRDLAVFDDGTGGGSSLYATGSFFVSGGQGGLTNVSEWNAGAGAWQAVSGGLQNGNGRAFVEHNVNGNRSLVTGGTFLTAGGDPAELISRYRAVLGFALDCDGNGFPDDCDLILGNAEDCDGNGQLDVCDIANDGAPDCNNNGRIDDCDIADGISMDENMDGVPDECEVGPFVRGDANDDVIVNIADAIFMLAHLFQMGASPTCFDAADINDDETVDISDVIFLINYLFVQGTPPFPPFPGCGNDPSGGAQDCDLYTNCP